MARQDGPATARPDNGDSPERSLRLVGASNFRDLGGYGAETGREVRWRTLFRYGSRARSYSASMPDSSTCCDAVSC